MGVGSSKGVIVECHMSLYSTLATIKVEAEESISVNTATYKFSAGPMIMAKRYFAMKVKSANENRTDNTRYLLIDVDRARTKPAPSEARPRARNKVHGMADAEMGNFERLFTRVGGLEANFRYRVIVGLK